MAEPATETPATDTPPPEAQPPPGVETTAPPVKSEDVEGAVSTVEMADVYRSLVTNLRDKLGGTINDANADAIARAAAQVYRHEVEPRLWEEKSAHELLDSLGVPRSGAFVPYSLSDRLLFLRRSGAQDPYRVQAHELLDELGVPRWDGAGHDYSLEARLTQLLGSFDNLPGVDIPNNGPASDGSDDGDGSESGDVDRARAGPDLVDALEAIHRAVGSADDQENANSPAGDGLGPPPPPAIPEPSPDLLGLGGLLGTIQEELVEVRQAVESLRQELHDAVALFRAGAGSGTVPPVVPAVPLIEGGPEIVARRLDAGPDVPAPEAAAKEASSEAGGPEASSGSAVQAPAEEAAPSEAEPGVGPDFVPPEAGSPNGEGGDSPPDTALAPPVPSEASGPDGAPDEPAAGSIGPHEPTRVLPAVPVAVDGPELAQEANGEEAVPPRRRSRRFALLVLLVILIGVLLAAGITAAIVLGWDELESRFLDTVTAPVWSGLGTTP